MKVGVAQFKPKFKSKEYNIKKIKEIINSMECELIVLPELATTGYSFYSKEEIKPFAETIPGETTNELKPLAKNKCIVLGMPEIEGNKIYNTAIAIYNDKIFKYRKLHLFYKEKFIFSQGNLPLNVFEINGVKIGMIICYDWIFPEVTRTLAIKGALIICQIANLILPYCQEAMKIRALENHVFIITANRIGKEREFKFTGKSQIVSTKGEILFQADSEKEDIKIIEIEPKMALNKKINKYNDLFKDRRREFYFK